MPQDAITHYSQLLDQLYGAALAPDQWPGALAAMAQWMGTTRALLFTPTTVPADGGFFYAHGLSAQTMTLWATRYQPMDIWAQRGVERGATYEGAIVLDRELCTMDELLASPWYTEFLVHLDIARVVWCNVFAGTDPHLPVAGFAFFRSLTDKPFADTDRRKLGMVMPHLSRALGLTFKLRDAQLRAAAGESALHALASGVVLLDGQGTVVFANHAAQALLQADSGLSVAQGRLRLSHPSAQRDWQTALRATLAPKTALVPHFAASVAWAPQEGAPLMTLQLSQLPDQNQLGLPRHAARAIVFLQEAKGKAQPDLNLLTRTWGLSRAEARTAVSASEGGKLLDVASRLGLSTNTVKTQLQQVYQKTGCASRADLTRLMLSLQ